MRNEIWHGDCLDLMERIPKGSVDMILCDLPYGVTRNKWDSVLDLGVLWRHYRRIVKRSGAVVLFGQDKFSARLMMSNEKWHRYNLVWDKTSPTGHLNAKRMPLRSHEDILVFYGHLPTYNPQKTSGHKRKISTAHHKRGSAKTSNYGDYGLVSYDSTERYPKSVVRFATDRQKSSLHPTQKPVALMEYLIRTYTNEGDLVLDNCAGSGTTGIACVNTKRDYLLIEKEEKYYNVAKERIRNHLPKSHTQQLGLFEI